MNTTFVVEYFFLFFCMSHPVHTRTHNSAYKLTNQTKLKPILMDLIWLKVLSNSFTVPYFLWKAVCLKKKFRLQCVTCYSEWICFCFLILNASTDPQSILKNKSNSVWIRQHDASSQVHYCISPNLVRF